MTTAVVVGAGPNGLAAAVTLAQHGVKVTVVEAAETIGGGTRSSEHTFPGVLHDDCSAVHPMGAGSPYLRTLDLDQHGLEWKWPKVDAAHPLDSGTAGIMLRSLEDTVRHLGVDGHRWRQLFGPLADRFDDLAPDLFRPIAHVPRHPGALVQLGLRALPPAAWLARVFESEEARALFAGIAAHVIHPLTRPATSSVGAMMIAAAHTHGWPVAAGGSQSITNALASLLGSLGGKIETGQPVRSLRDLPSSDIVMLDLAPRGVVEVTGDLLPARVRRAYNRYRHGPGAFKVDLAVEGGVPWINEDCGRAGTVHLGGTLDEIVAAERDIARGIMPPRPFVLIGQQYLADPGRSSGDVHPIWAYAHVPHGYSGDATEAIIGQIERFAPGTRERIVGAFSRSTAAMSVYNPNYIGGDIITGENNPVQLLLRPRIALDPYRTGIDGVYICSAATPPGAGVHGMCGHNAALSALRHSGHSGGR
ncbi:NAD(P)/FAD-dependent oxidoreductase [Rhodococcus sp. NPDC019627]|uniref:phytoene desaturase family protein n=1 Tax=unclassified Rhodococcus (in: high G+C Gram-positive bacteria) TaxID=192944 RepID=UPI0033DB497B